MPFKSKAQKAWMYTNKPELAKEWSKAYEKNYLPDRLHPKRVRKKGKV
jgi:hypothetical protein|tara:strand:+ start:33499 stop:33642 length:144 start_codon:yes stop_codon:yes gene_type:complete